MKLLEGCFWVVAALWAAAALVPATYWYDPRDMRIDDIVEGDQLELLYSGGTVRDFIGSYSVIMREAGRNEIVGEDRSARFRYRSDSNRPDPLTIEWWAPGDERFHNLRPGSYQMRTCWTVHDAFFGLVPGKTVCSESNIFRVLPSDLAAVRPVSRP